MALTDYIVKINFMPHYLKHTFTKFQINHTIFGKVLVKERTMLP